MQTFLPYPDFKKSARTLDWKRLGRQRVEAYQILRTLSGLSAGWRSHPAVRMWAGYELALSAYMNDMIEEWLRRGYRNNMYTVALDPGYPLPPWLGDPAFHRAHRSNLIRKDPAYYRRFWPALSDDLPYVWPLP
ncbi:MAG: MSMEG_6728 family protein [bacterium]|nr:MAG: MSMEG_6728 family protein [bacterium]